MAKADIEQAESVPGSHTAVGTDDSLIDEKFGKDIENVASDGSCDRGNETLEQGYDLEACQNAKERVSWYKRILHRSRNAVEENAAGRSTESESEPEAVITRTLDDRPVGYNHLATYQSSDRNFMQFRSFGYLHTRLLLALQQEISALERELDELDDWDSSQDGNERKLSCKQRDDRQDTVEEIGDDFPFDRTRPEVLNKLKKKLMEYDDVLLKTKDIMALQRPAKKDWESLRWWLHDKKPLVNDEQDFILHKEDVISLRKGRECAGFDAGVERCLNRIDKFVLATSGSNIVQRIFTTPELQQKTNNSRLHYYAPARVDTLVNVIITSIIFVLLVLPVVAMYELGTVDQSASPFEAIGILVIFTLLFGMAMSGLTKATRQELFAASAAYAAVLVVFIGNFSTQTVEIGPITPSNLGQ